MFHRAIGVAHAMSAALGLSLCAAAAQAAPDDEIEGFDPAPASVLQSQGLQPSPPAFDLRVAGDGAGAMRAGPLHRTVPLAGGVSWLPRQELLVRGTLMRAQLSEDTSLSVRLRRGRLGVYVAIRWP